MLTVLISTSEYEILKEYEAMMEAQEDDELISMVKERVSKPYKTISQKDLLKALDIKPEELN
ncbi:MAG: hypothetical protein U9P72_06140 [Campylobacterota bacterium]|nr:hypothetical protein [Campylobacterota bacterium]